MKIERLMSIIVTLLAKKSVTASELAERFQVTTRTIYRDIDTLSLAGIPIYSKKGINGGFYLDEDYKLTNLFFSDAEKQLIYEVSHGLTKSVSHPDFEELNQKMSYLVDSSKKATPYLFDFTLWKTSQVMLEKIEQGIEENKTITFEYVSYKGETTFREVQPINLVYKSQVWYVYAYCLMRQDYRLFRISRMRQVVLLTNTFDPNTHQQMTKTILDSFYSGLETKIEMTEVSLEFDKKARVKVYDTFQMKDIIELDNILLVNKKFPKDSWLVEMLLSFGGSVRVMSPEWLKIDIMNEAKQILAKYDIM